MTSAREGHLQVTRTARYWVAGGEAAAPSQVWFVLHGYRQLARRFLRRFQPLADGTRWIVAPEALSRFYTDPAPGRHGATSAVGASWMTREDREHEIDDYVRYLDRVAEAVLDGHPGPAPTLVVVGFSQGVATAARWTALGSVRPHHLVLWGDWLPPDLPRDTAARRWMDVTVSLVRGDRDPIFAPEARLSGEEEAAALAAAGIRTRVVAYPEGHDIHQPTLQALAREIGDS